MVEVAETETESADIEEKPEISILALTGSSCCSTMKLEAMVNNRRLQLLIDSEKLGCKVAEVPPLPVLVANGNEIACNRVCRGFRWSMQGQQFTAEVFLFPLENYHMVFLMFLIPLDDILWNFKILTMKFKKKNQVCELKGK